VKCPSMAPSRIFEEQDTFLYILLLIHQYLYMQKCEYICKMRTKKTTTSTDNKIHVHFYI